MALTNSQYDSIMRIYTERQLKARRDLDARREEAFAKIPRLAEIDAEVASVSVKKAMQLLHAGDAQNTRNFDADRIIDDLAEERRVLLQTSGLGIDYLEPRYHCEKCRDTGYVNNHKCTCFKQLEIEMLYSGSHIADIIQKENFQTFDLNCYSDQLQNSRSGLTARQEAEKALLHAREFVDSFPSGPNRGTAENLCIYGNVGTGKTFLTHCIAGALLASGHSVLYMTAYDLFDLLGHYKFDNSYSVKESRDSIFECELLIIDDLGTEMNNNFTTSELFLLINERILRNRSTIISTNLSLENFRDAFSERTFSRIMGSYKLIHMSGSDIRIQKKLSGGK